MRLDQEQEPAFGATAHGQFDLPADRGQAVRPPARPAPAGGAGKRVPLAPSRVEA
jgi:hypothetical protein